MANEAALITRIEDPIDFTVNDGQGFLKGTILFLSGARTVYPTAADNNPVIGIAARDKVAGDGRTSIAVFTRGIFGCKFDTVVTNGMEVTVSGANILKTYTTLDDEKGYVLGRILETAAAGGGTYQVLVGGC